jgi:hypothetical protein
MPIRFLPKSLRQRPYLLAALILVSLSIWSVFVHQGHQEARLRSDFANIRAGMTLKEARAAIDPAALWSSLPTGGSTAQQYLITWDDSNTAALVTFVSGAVNRKQLYPPKPSSIDDARNWWYVHIGPNPPF